jgi:hypothetical protein
LNRKQILKVNFDDPTWAQKVNSVEMRSSKRFTTRRSRDGATSLAAPVSLSRTHGVSEFISDESNAHRDGDTEKYSAGKTLMARFGRNRTTPAAMPKKREQFFTTKTKKFYSRTLQCQMDKFHISPSSLRLHLYFFLLLLLWDAESVAFYSMPTGHEWTDGLLLDDATYDGVRDDHRWVRGLGMLTDTQYGSDQFIYDQRRSTFPFKFKIIFLKKCSS